MKLIDRADYLEKLKLWQGQTDLVKIITGVRRCGKSKLFELFQEYLKSAGVGNDQITSINLEDETQTGKAGLKLDRKSKLLEDYKVLLDFIVKNLAKGKKNYIFLNEIQLLDNWQRLANTLRVMITLMYI